MEHLTRLYKASCQFDVIGVQPEAEGTVQVGQSARILASGTLQLLLYGILTKPIMVVFTKFNNASSLRSLPHSKSKTFKN